MLAIEIPASSAGRTTDSSAQPGIPGNGADYGTAGGTYGTAAQGPLARVAHSRTSTQYEAGGNHQCNYRFRHFESPFSYKVGLRFTGIFLYEEPKPRFNRFFVCVFRMLFHPVHEHFNNFGSRWWWIGRTNHGVPGRTRMFRHVVVIGAHKKTVTETDGFPLERITHRYGTQFHQIPRGIQLKFVFRHRTRPSRSTQKCNEYQNHPFPFHYLFLLSRLKAGDHPLKDKAHPGQ
jgi:hypothetical protein